MKTESEFVRDLERRASEQRSLVQTAVLPPWARGVGEWMTVNPWRLLIPAAVFFYALLRILYGIQLREFVLGLFGGFA